MATISFVPLNFTGFFMAPTLKEELSRSHESLSDDPPTDPVHETSRLLSLDYPDPPRKICRVDIRRISSSRARKTSAPRENPIRASKEERSRRLGMEEERRRNVDEESV